MQSMLNPDRNPAGRGLSTHGRTGSTNSPFAGASGGYAYRKGKPEIPAHVEEYWSDDTGGAPCMIPQQRGRPDGKSQAIKLLGKLELGQLKQAQADRARDIIRRCGSCGMCMIGTLAEAEQARAERAKNTGR